MDAERPFRASRCKSLVPKGTRHQRLPGELLGRTAEPNKPFIRRRRESQSIFSELTGQKVDETFTSIPPFYKQPGGL